MFILDSFIVDVADILPKEGQVMVEFINRVCSSVHRKLCNSLQLQPQRNQNSRISQGNSGD